MEHIYIRFLLTLGYGINAGFFFAFSNTIMSAFSGLTDFIGASAMRAINVTVLNFGFGILFGGTAIISFIALIYGDTVLRVAAVIYLLGCVLVTLRLSVPLNDMLAKDNLHWISFQQPWLLWNHVRFFACLVSFIILLLWEPLKSLN